MHACHCVCGGGSEDNLQEIVDSLLPESSRDQTLVAQDNGKCPYLLSHLSGLKVMFPTCEPTSGQLLDVYDSGSSWAQHKTGISTGTSMLC